MPFPNKATQFKPGQSGNPKGLTPGTKHKSTWIQELTADDGYETVLTTANGYANYKGAPFGAIVQTAIHRALHDKEKGLGYMEWLAKHGWPDLPAQGNTLNIGVSIYNGLSGRPEAIDVSRYDGDQKDIPAQTAD